jgi:Flp pilus assembly protein TadB
VSLGSIGVQLLAQIAVRIALAVLAVWAGARGLRMAGEVTRANAESLVRAAGPGVTRYDELANTEQRISAIEDWESLHAQRIGWLWDLHASRLSLTAAALAALAVAGSFVSPWFLWVPIGVLSLAPLWRLGQLRDQRAQALAQLARRRDELAGLVKHP